MGKKYSEKELNLAEEEAGVVRISSVNALAMPCESLQMNKALPKREQIFLAARYSLSGKSFSIKANK